MVREVNDEIIKKSYFHESYKKYVQLLWPVLLYLTA